nr:hypothetical protein [Amylibacter sp.]
MSDNDYSSDVHVLRPRKISVSKKLDGFLNHAGLTPSSNVTTSDKTRPCADGKNAITCAGCCTVEYLTRDHCRCGHYLRGQLEDEYFAWEQKIRAKHAELSDEVERSTKPLRVFYLLAIPFILVPCVRLIFWADAFNLSTFLWWTPAMLLAGAGVFAETQIFSPFRKNARFVENFTFETFVEQRHRLEGQNYKP